MAYTMSCDEQLGASLTRELTLLRASGLMAASKP